MLKTGIFPIDHLDILVGEECSTLIDTAPNFDFTSVEGLLRCQVLPPRNLFHSILPYRTRGKLLFALCRTCCETFSQIACTHDEPAERAFEGTWVSCELRKAIEKVISCCEWTKSGNTKQCVITAIRCREGCLSNISTAFSTQTGGERVAERVRERRSC